MITLDAYLQGRNLTYPSEWHPSIAENAKILLSKVNDLLLELKVPSSEIEVASGWRPASYNRMIGGAPSSWHVKGMAIDLIDDPDRPLLAPTIADNYQLLEKYGLWMEEPTHTRGWVHLDMGTRQERPVRIFLP